MPKVLSSFAGMIRTGSDGRSGVSSLSARAMGSRGVVAQCMSGGWSSQNIRDKMLQPGVSGRADGGVRTGLRADAGIHNQPASRATVAASARVVVLVFAIARDM